ncbi:glycoside hydrolase family 16 protein [Venturia nashicola]|uniref:Glycoside hydrolase family 16 protein n=1 Tax=Venturia nashicola TaxID=86259 RepID=A0A4Z1NTZ7_9PEZI|nr:glycoside hydrolase family 16 protein [Venturia nashicola]
MPFKDSLGKFMGKLEGKLEGKLDDKLGSFQQNTNTPPQIPFSSKPQSDTSSSSSPYWKADFSPSCPVSTNFKHEIGDWGWGNNELENYTSDPTNSFHTERHELVLRAIIASNQPDSKSRYTSARLTSHQLLERRRGYIEATVTAPSARGIWPAFWLLPQEPFKWPEDGEVDIMESWNAETMNHACMHWGHFNGQDSQKHRVVESSISNIRAMHVYGFAWEQPECGDGGRCVWYIDGKAVMKAHKPPGTRRFEEWRIILNVAVGGDVCCGVVPSDGCYDLVVHGLKMCDGPGGGGWHRFEKDWHKTREGHYRRLQVEKAAPQFSSYLGAKIRDMIWTLTASYHTIQEGLDYDDFEHFILRTGIDYTCHIEPMRELKLVTPAILLVNHEIYPEAKACLARQGVSIYGPPRIDADPRELPSWELLCCVISPTTLRNISKFSLDVSGCGKCWIRCKNDKGPCIYSLVPADCSKSWFFFIMALCDNADNVPEHVLISNGSVKYTLRREQLPILGMRAHVIKNQHNCNNRSLGFHNSDKWTDEFETLLLEVQRMQEGADDGIESKEEEEEVEAEAKAEGRELRDTIYDYSLSYDGIQKMIISDMYDKTTLPNAASFLQTPSILLVDKQTSSEAISRLQKKELTFTCPPVCMRSREVDLYHVIPWQSFNSIRRVGFVIPEVKKMKDCCGCNDDLKADFDPANFLILWVCLLDVLLRHFARSEAGQTSQIESLCLQVGSQRHVIHGEMIFVFATRAIVIIKSAWDSHEDVWYEVMGSILKEAASMHGQGGSGSTALQKNKKEVTHQ